MQQPTATKLTKPKWVWGFNLGGNKGEFGGKLHME